MKIIEGRYFKELTESSGGDVAVPTVLPWYPDNLAYQLNVTRKEIRRQEIYFRLHNFLVAETESGSISRQETVSMLPPLVLGVKPHHTVLDMCAAPGSKVSPILDLNMMCCSGQCFRRPSFWRRSMICPRGSCPLGWWWPMTPTTPAATC